MVGGTFLFKIYKRNDTLYTKENLDIKTQKNDTEFTLNLVEKYKINQQV